MKKKTTLSVDVAIAAYNAERNIARLVNSMLEQKEINYKLNHIIVNSDSSTDKTVAIAKSIRNNKVKVIDSKLRAGFAGALVSLVKSNKADILMLLNDDIIVKDSYFIEKIIKPFYIEENIGLVCGNPQAFKSNSFISEAVRSGYNAYKRMSEALRQGNNVYTVDGKALCFSRKLTKIIKFPKDYKIMGNVDKFIYFSSISNKLKYRYVNNAIMYFKCPSTINDFTKWQIRNYKSNNYIVRMAWGKLVDEEYKYSKMKFVYYKLIEFLKNPIGSMFILTLGIYCSIKAASAKREFEITWDLVQTTKNL